MMDVLDSEAKLLNATFKNEVESSSVDYPLVLNICSSGLVW
jgi:hypothetical protein